MVLSILFDATPPTDIWHDWQFWGVIVGVIGVVAAIVIGVVAIRIARKQQIRKELSYEIVSDVPILSVRKEVVDRTEIRFDGKVVENVRLIMLKVKNTGNVPILSEDFKEPVRFSFGGAEVLDSEIVDVQPKYLRVKWIVEAAKSIFLEPLLLNRDDEVRLKVLLSGIRAEISVTARVVGVHALSDIREMRQNRSAVYDLLTLAALFPGMLMLLLGMIYLIVFFAINEPPSPPPRVTVSPPAIILYIFLFGLLLFFAGMGMSFLRRLLSRRSKL